MGSAESRWNYYGGIIAAKYLLFFEGTGTILDQIPNIVPFNNRIHPLAKEKYFRKSIFSSQISEKLENHEVSVWSVGRTPHIYFNLLLVFILNLSVHSTQALEVLLFHEDTSDHSKPRTVRLRGNTR